VGPFIEGAGGGGLTGSDWRATVEGGIGWGVPVGSIAIAPTARFVQVVQPNGGLNGRDARLVLVGVELTFLDRRPGPTEPSDRDHDGILDDDDGCPDEPEDRDGFEDDDGCPDRDNDRDGVPDVDDGCPLVPEDADGFEDEDGCPDVDNDGDGILDAQDECPNEPEVVNGVDDADGCPDSGLVELVGDRVVLDEEVLFDFERARLRPGAEPVLAALVALWGQHPEWGGMHIEGHADVRGDERFNRELSQERARNVLQALIAAGAPEDRLEARGYGSTRPRDMRDTELAHRRNRRVEFVVVREGTAQSEEAR
jgi:outer membrane protein OmpA-like peptidoglycan-associated protein